MTGILNHLWQSSAFAAIVALAAWALRRNSPRARYWLWLAASLKFLIPFSWIVSIAARVQLPPNTPSLRALPVTTISTYFAPVSMPVNPVPVKTPLDWAFWLGLLWLAGAFFLAIRRCRQWLALRRLARGATPVSCECRIPVLSSTAGIEPGIFGILRPVLLLPEGLADTLTPAQFNGILAHELRHARCRDNLTAALHMGVETMFWFYPPVWWIGARLMDERERDCDEAALVRGGSPGEYARSILQVCERYAGSPLPCAAGISGADLKQRVCIIMTWRKSLPVTLRAKLGLVLAAAFAVLVPFGVGIARGQSPRALSHSNEIQAPTRPATAHFEAASIKPSAPDTRGDLIGMKSPSEFEGNNVSANELITWAYQVRDFQIVDAPGWTNDLRFDIAAATGFAPTDAAGTMQLQDKVPLMVQSLLTDRFGMKMHHETRDLPLYALVAAPGGLKLPASQCVPREARTPQTDNGIVCGVSRRSAPGTTVAVTLSGVHMDRLAIMLENITGREVEDRTGYTGTFDANLDFAPLMPANATDTGPPQPVSNAPSLFTALQQQLGLKLESTHGPVDVLVIDRIEKPTAN